jgi:CelD/BcsL family acetyltransferase involved in cellulose biosynthesis
LQPSQTFAGKLSLVDTPAAIDFAGRPERIRAAAAARAFELVELTAVPRAAWHSLFARAAEPNAFYSPDWVLAVRHHTRNHDGAKALLAWDGPAKNRLIGLLPVVTSWRALKLPLPVLVAWQSSYVPLVAPLLDRDNAMQAAGKLLDAAKAAGAQALLMPFLPEEGAASGAFRDALAARTSSPFTLHAETRALLTAAGDADAMLADALGAKKQKELRRQRNRLSDDGALRFAIAEAPHHVGAALDQFLKLEASGWKGKRGTALGSEAGDVRFIKDAAAKCAAQNSFKVATLSRGADVIAAGLIVQHGSRAFFYKVAHDETLAKWSPGVQLTLELTKYFCADESVSDVDSTATADHPMINQIWRGRLSIGEVLLPAGEGSSLRLIRFAISLRRYLRDGARRVVHLYRSFKEKSQ